MAQTGDYTSHIICTECGYHGSYTGMWGHFSLKIDDPCPECGTDVTDANPTITLRPVVTTFTGTLKVWQDRTGKEFRRDFDFRMHPASGWVT